MTVTRTIPTPQGDAEYFPLADVADAGRLARLPYVVRVMLENLLRHQGRGAGAAQLDALARWPASGRIEIPFHPARVVMQDLTGVPVVADLGAMRDAVARLGGDPSRVNPRIHGDLVIDHSVIVDAFGVPEAFQRNVAREVERNTERYAFLRWAQRAFDRFSVVPPGAGIVHQVNLEFFAKVVMTEQFEGRLLAIPDTLLGTDSHTTMIGGLSVLGWGVGGIEAEAALLGEPVAMLPPLVVGVKLTGRMREGATATDLVLTVTEMLRDYGVVGKFVEFFGPALDSLTVADRATISNMSPEYGATEGIFPIDAQTLSYMTSTGRDLPLINLVERYAREQSLFRDSTSVDPEFDETLELDLGTVEPSLAGPRRSHDRVAISDVPGAYKKELAAIRREDSPMPREVKLDGTNVGDGSVVIAAITSCTNTSNPSVMVAAGLLARNAVARGLKVPPFVKTSLAPGSPVVMDYLRNAGLIQPLEALGFYLVGFGCTTCIAEGTPVLEGAGTARPIEQLPPGGGASVFGAAPDGGIATAPQTAAFEQGLRECVALTMQDGRMLICTPDHQVLRQDGRWVRADELEPGTDRVVVGLDVPVDEPQCDEAGYVLRTGTYTFAMDTPAARQRTLAFARLLGHLLDDGSISRLGQARVNVGQAVDRQAALADIELITGKRPAGTRYDDRKWSIVLPSDLAAAIVSLAGVRVGRRIDQTPSLPDFILEDHCPVSVVREFLAGAFGADGTAPLLKRLGAAEASAILEQPAYSHSVKAEHVEAQKTVMLEIVKLLRRCNVQTDRAAVREYPVRRAASSYDPPQDGASRVEVRLELTDGLSFVTNVGFRYCVAKSLRASAAAVYWRTVASITDGFPSPAQVLHEIGARDWFAALQPRSSADFSKRYCVAKESLTLPTFSLKVLDRRPAGPRPVYDISVADLQSFVAGSVVVHNCIGNSGPLPDDVSAAVDENDLAVAAVLSGNRNFEGRIHQQVRMAFLASPPLVVAYALAGSVDVDLDTQPLGTDGRGRAVMLAEIWPSDDEISKTVEAAMDPGSYRERFGHIYDGTPVWNGLAVPDTALYRWDTSSTYIARPPFLDDAKIEPEPVKDITGARVLVIVGDSVTTDHISPAGPFAATAPAGQWLIDHGVSPAQFNTYGSRRGHHEVMIRGTFANIRLRNKLVAPKEGGYTEHQPSGEQMTIFEASQRYKAENVPLLAIAGKEYGTGSSRDWAAKGPALLGIRAVIAESYERIHRTNLIQMGVLPLQFPPGDGADSLGLSGREVYAIEGLTTLDPGMTVRVLATKQDGSSVAFDAVCRLDSPTEVRYYREGGILPAVVRELVRSNN
jgi:aconitase A